MSLGGRDGGPLTGEETETPPGEVAGPGSHSDWNSAMPDPTSHTPTPTSSCVLEEAKSPGDKEL